MTPKRKTTLEIFVEQFKRETGRVEITDGSDTYKLLEHYAMTHDRVTDLITQVEDLAVLVKDVQKENIYLRKRIGLLECDVNEIAGAV